MSRRLVGVAVALVVLLAAGGAALVGVGSSDEPPRKGWYLALGDSLAAGYQPDTGDQRSGGYVGEVLTAVRADEPGTELVNLACSGATTASMLAEDGACTYEEGSQLAQATAFLRANAGDTRLVTLDIGANDILRCALGGIDPMCATSALETIDRNLGRILGELRDAAGRDVELVVLNYYNPVLAAWLAGDRGQALARQSVPSHTRLNQVIAARAMAVRAEVADVAGAFESTSWEPTPSGATTVPTNVARICAWTWMCSRSDIHANDAGYAVLADAVEARLG